MQTVGFLHIIVKSYSVKCLEIMYVATGRHTKKKEITLIGIEIDLWDCEALEVIIKAGVSGFNEMSHLLFNCITSSK